METDSTFEMEHYETSGIHYYWLLLAEGHLRRRLFGSMLRMIAALPLPDG